MQILGTLFLSANTTRLKSISKKGWSSVLKLAMREEKQQIFQTLELRLVLLEIMTLRKYTWRRLYPYPEILEIEEKSSKSFKVTPLCTYLKIRSKTPFRVFICALKSMRS